MIFFQSLLSILSTLELRLSGLSGKKIIIEGDSITEGYPVSLSQRWTSLFCNALGAVEINRGVSSKALQDGNNCTSPNFDITTIPINDNTHGLYIMALGTNDILFHNGSFTPSLYKATLIQAMEEAKQKGWARNKLLILSPYYIKAGYGIGGFCGSAMWNSARFNDYITAAKQAAESARVMYCDITSAYGDSVLNLDGIHPDVNGHSMLNTFLLSKTFKTL